MTLEFNLTFTDATNKRFDITRVTQLKEFAATEYNYWKAASEVVYRIGSSSIQSNFSAAVSTWVAVLNTLERWKDNFEAWDQNTAISNLTNQWREWQNQLNSRWVWSGHSFNDTWIESYRFSQETGDAFFNAIVKNSANNIGAFNTLKGMILAYEFALQDESLLTKRRKSEEKTFSRLQNQLFNKKDELMREVTDFQIEITAWKDSTQKEYSDWHQDIHTKLTENESERESTLNYTLDAWKAKIELLEQTYHEKLRLAAPATFWKERADSLRCQGAFWAVLLVLTSVILTAGAGTFFWEWLHKEPMPFGLQSLQGVALFGTTAAVAIFLIKTLSKLTFSAFHLQRDAEEKEQLTHLYLSLVNEGAIDSTSRDIILQALFSRAETGLLAGDSGPTMPGIDSLASLAKAGAGAK